MKTHQQRIFLDYAAGAPVQPRVLAEMEKAYLETQSINPNGLYREAQKAKDIYETARNHCAEVLECQKREIIFTAGATESINLALQGVALAAAQPGHIISTAIEHKAVLNTLNFLKAKKWQVTLLPTDLPPKDFVEACREAIQPNTKLISVMYVNNETGHVLPIAQLAHQLKQINSERTKKKLGKIYLHTDACQAGVCFNLNVGKLGIDLLSLNGSKLGGPMQSGLLYVKSGTILHPIIFGGGQEFNLRSGTQNIPAAVGLATALSLSQKKTNSEHARLTQLKAHCIKQLEKKKIPYVVNQTAGMDYSPHVLNIALQGFEGEMVLMYLDSAGIAISTGSACESQNQEASHVLLAQGYTYDRIKSSIRISFGAQTSRAHITTFVRKLSELIPIIANVENQLM